jgi:hypothetical protein
MVIKGKSLAEKYSKNWQEHAGHSEAYKEKGDGREN